MRLRSSLSLSISAPLRPMTMPGRAVVMVIRQRLAARSMRICGTDADSSFFLSKSRIWRSSVSSLPNSFLPAYHLERQSRLTAIRRPIGFVFCPILQLFIGENDFDVAIALENRAGGTAGFGCKTPQNGCGLGHSFLNDQIRRVKVAIFRFVRLEILGISHGGFERLGDNARA